jgi:hypothetical protein
MSLGSDREGKTLRWPVVHAAPPDKAQIKIPPFFRVSIAHAHAQCPSSTVRNSLFLSFTGGCLSAPRAPKLSQPAHLVLPTDLYHPHCLSRPLCYYTSFTVSTIVVYYRARLSSQDCYCSSLNFRDRLLLSPLTSSIAVSCQGLAFINCTRSTIKTNYPSYTSIRPKSLKQSASDRRYPKHQQRSSRGDVCKTICIGDTQSGSLIPRPS